MDPSFFRCKQVLIVEDCAPVRATIKSMLQTMGFEAIHLARNSTEALKKCYEIPFDFILCDFNLGDCKDGYQLFEALKQQELISPLCCFMIISAESQRKIVHGMIELQPDDYLLKPFSYPVLEERIVRMVKTKIALRKIYLAIAEQDYALAIAECDKALQAKPELNQTTYRLKGELLLQTKAYKKAENYYRTLKENKNYPWARLGYAIAGFRQERWEDSELELVDLTQFDETKVEALDWLSRLLVKQSRFRQACDTLAEAALLSPKNITRQQTLSNLTSIIGDKEAAARIHSKLVAAARHSIHDTADNYLNHARALIDLAQTKSVMERAVQLQHASQLVTGLSKRFNEALVQQEVQLVRGRILAAKGQLAEAKELIHGITGLKSKKLTIDSCMDAAKAYFEIGDLYESEYYIEEMRRHLAKDDFLTETQQLMLKMEKNRHQELKDKIKTINQEASAAYQHGHYGRASELFFEAFQFMPSNPVIALNMLQAMSKGTGLTAETMKLARQAIALIEQGELSITNQQRYKKYYRTLISKHPELATKTRAQSISG
ncbi:response regulator [Alkalimonas sp. NCh-2]|uniref:response regulator n=1 Tax=Alkalimonas sp. NCh-2 TaxID=3144846 RepID=UPI0031F64553